MKSHDQAPPELVITSPSENLTGDKKIREKDIIFKGYAKDESGIYVVTVNGEEAHLEADGSFTAKVLLAMGRNEIEVQAIDPLKNVVTKTVFIERIQDEEKTPETTEEHRSLEAITRISGEINYYALIIGVEKYESAEFSDLDNPLKDARSLYEILKEEYSFEEKNIFFLQNPSYEEIISAFDNIEKKSTENDNLLVFYAGHGYWDSHAQRGYWLPANGFFH